MAEAERLDPETDREAVPLPEGLKVGCSRTGIRFHLIDDGLPICESREVVDSIEELAVQEAREERGLAACRSCFRVGFRRQRAGAPCKVLVRIGHPSVYHSVGRSGHPECMYGPERSEATYVEIARQKALEAELGPCTGCFGFDPDQMASICPLCGSDHEGRKLSQHLQQCPSREEIAR